MQQQLAVDIAYDTLRAIAVEHVLNHLALYSDSVDHSMHTFIDKMSQNKQWADEIHLRALSRALNLSLVIVRSDEKVTVLRREKPHAVLYLGYEVGVHYQSLTVQTPALCEQLHQERVDSAEIDTGFDSDLSLDALKKLGTPTPISLASDAKKIPSTLPKVETLPQNSNKEDKKRPPLAPSTPPPTAHAYLRQRPFHPHTRSNYPPLNKNCSNCVTITVTRLTSNGHKRISY